MKRPALQRLVRQRQARNDAATPTGPVRKTDATVQPTLRTKRRLSPKCDQLAQQRDIPNEFRKSLSARGVVGEGHNASIIYLALTSRLLGQPISIAVKGPSAAGKSKLVSAVLDYFPAEAWYALTSMSEHALVYSDEPISHRFLILYEATGLSNDRTSYFIRSLLSEGSLAYETVRNGRTILIKRKGPTGFITTTTDAHLHPENETRMLSISVRDTTDQTRAVMIAQATETRDGHQDSIRAWRTLQEQLSTERAAVIVPFAIDLAALIAPVAVRLRRDFPMILTLTKAHALLHRRTRDRDKSGNIIAKVRDYSAVRRLVNDIILEGVEAIAAPQIRETVDAVRVLQRHMPTPTVLAVAKQLGLDKSSASRRVTVAISQSYLVNLESTRGRPARLKLGQPMPNESQVLPLPGAVWVRFKMRSHGAKP